MSWNPTRGLVMKEMCIRRIYERDVMFTLNVEVDEAISVDFTNYAVGRADELESAALNNDSHAVNQILKSHKKQVPMSQERLLDEDGKYVVSYTAERVVVRVHFQGSL